MQDKRPQRPKSHPRPRASNVGRAVTRGAVKVSPRPKQTIRAVAQQHRERQAIQRPPMRAVGRAATSGAIKSSPRPGKTIRAVKRVVEEHTRTDHVRKYQVGSAGAKASRGARRVVENDTRSQLIHDVFPDLQRDSKRFWPLVRRHYGLPKNTPAPKTVVGSKAMESRAAAYVLNKKPKVYVEPSELRVYKNPKTKDLALSVLLHEWAHTRQRKDVLGRAAEGGAAAFQKEITKKLGLNAYPQAPTYAKWARRTERKKGRRYVLKGQFKGDR